MGYLELFERKIIPEIEVIRRSLRRRKYMKLKKEPETRLEIDEKKFLNTSRKIIAPLVDEIVRWSTEANGVTPFSFSENDYKIIVNIVKNQLELKLLDNLFVKKEKLNAYDFLTILKSASGWAKKSKELCKSRPIWLRNLGIMPRQQILDQLQNVDSKTKYFANSSLFDVNIKIPSTNYSNSLNVINSYDKYQTFDERSNELGPKKEIKKLAIPPKFKNEKSGLSKNSKIDDFIKNSLGSQIQLLK